jgi:hypothetical protein
MRTADLTASDIYRGVAHPFARYMHRNPVRRGLVERPEDWPWSSFRHYAAGVESRVEIESQWTARKRERLGIFVQLGRREQNKLPHPSPTPGERVGHPPWAGAGGSGNSSGVVSGNTLGVPGASATLTYGFCF